MVLLALVALLSLVGAGAAAAAAPAAPASTASGTGVHLVLQSLSPAALGPSDDLQVVVRVTNPTTKTLAGGRVRLFVNSPVLTSRSAVAAWAADEGVQGGDRFAGVAGAEHALSSPLPPGASSEVTITVRAAALRLGSTWGARGVTVDLLDSRLARLDAVRTFVVWTPAGTPASTAGLTVLTPVVADAPDPATGAAGGLAALTSPGGRLSRVLAAAGAAPSAGAELVVDPATLPVTASTGGSSTSAAAPAWLDAMKAATTGPSALLPLHDADLDALAAARAGDLYRLAVDAARRRGAVASSSPPVLAWPATGSVGAAGLDLASATGADALVLSSASVKAAPGRVSLVSAGQRSPEAGVVVDAAASAVLATGTAQGSATGPAAATARLLAEAAVAARSGGHVVLATPRSWDPDPAAAGSVLGTLASAPWVRAQSLTALLASSPTASVSLPVGAADPGALPASGLRQVDAALARVVPISGAVADPESLLAPVRERALAATSVAWRAGGGTSRLAAWQSAIDVLRTDADADATGVRVLQGSPVTAISSRVSLPITVANTLDQPVTVVVSLRSGSLRVSPQGQRTTVVSAKAQQQLSLPVKALASGDARLTVVLRTTDGALVGTGGVIDVRVRADWEGRGVAVVGGVLGLVLVIGIIRTARRVRRSRRPALSRPPVRGPSPGHPAHPGHRATDQTGGRIARPIDHPDHPDHPDHADHADRATRRQPEHHA